MVVVFITSLKEDNTNNFYFYIAFISYISAAIFYNVVANTIDILLFFYHNHCFITININAASIIIPNNTTDITPSF